MEKIFVIGHKSPDTDSVVSAITFSSLFRRKDFSLTPAVAGKINKETRFVLSYFKEKTPVVINEQKAKRKKFFLVDHNDPLQSVAKKENITGVLDHHLLSGLKTDVPIFFRTEQLGSTASLIYKIVKEEKRNINKKQGGLLLAGIISDTLNLNSPTTTSEDIDFYYELSKISGVDGSNLAEKMFAAKSDFSGEKLENVISGDLKEYEFGKEKVAIGVAETTSFEFFKKNEKKIIKEVASIKRKRKFGKFFFFVIDIIKQNAFLYTGSEDENIIAKKLFQGKKEGEGYFLEGISSRKKQIAPVLSRYYGKS